MSQMPANNALHRTLHLPQKSGHNDLTIGGVHEEDKNLSDRKNEETQIQQ
jgi:hypothetical protein